MTSRLRSVNSPLGVVNRNINVKKKLANIGHFVKRCISHEEFEKIAVLLSGRRFNFQLRKVG